RIFEKELPKVISPDNEGILISDGKRRERETGIRCCIDTYPEYIVVITMRLERQDLGFFSRKWSDWYGYGSNNIAKVHFEQKRIEVFDKRAFEYFKKWGEQHEYYKLERCWK
ncbi:unnamed protein product, partial [marine sediment metagenome]